MQNKVLFYKSTTKKRLTFIVILIAVSLVAFISDLLVGSSKMPFNRLIGALFGFGDQTDIVIVKSVRLPRVISAVVVGAGLAVSGLIMQNVLKNPMASPSTLGVGNASVFGANIALAVFSGVLGKNVSVATSVTSLVFAIGAMLFILFLSAKRKFSPETVVLGGVATGYFFSAATTVLQYFLDDQKLGQVIFWTFGDLSRASGGEIIAVSAVTACALVYFIANAKNYNALSAGEDTAKSMGVNVSALRFLSLLIASSLCAVVVAFYGVIGFIGLIAPHIARKLIGNDNRFLIIGSSLVGVALTLIADVISHIAVGISLPVGAVTSLVGAPLLIVLLYRSGGKRQ